MKSYQTIKGKFQPKNLEKYLGDSRKIIYRSLWERKFMLYCDKTPEVLEWSSEEVRIKYEFKGQPKNYYPDFYVKFINESDEIEECIVEIKPYYQMSWGKNKAKWQFARDYCQAKNYTFKILTEREIL